LQSTDPPDFWEAGLTARDFFLRVVTEMSCRLFFDFDDLGLATEAFFPASPEGPSINLFALTESM
jgi:hypothetical protein